MKKLLIITGGSKGIGKGIVDKFLFEKYSVINIARTANHTKNVINIIADLSKEGVEKVIENKLPIQLKEKNIICLVHNAACHHPDEIGKQNKIELSQSLAVGIIAPVLLNNLIIPFMDKGSSILYIGSSLSEKAVKNAASYIISKHALVGLMKATCQDLSDYPLHTCIICPGFTETEMLRTHMDNDDSKIELAKHKVGAKRLIQPAEIAEIVYLSAINPILNGSVLHANLGQLET